MAKKGGAQQLQAEINTDDELYRFLEKPGLLVLDVYSEWCGPCLAMVGSLRKIKLEVGGDNLNLAICKSDTIEALKRFRNKSEPTWLFCCQGKAVNLMFGTDVPQLMSLINKELKEINKKQRDFYEITELQPEERARRDVIEQALADAQRKEIEEARRERHEYLTFVTNEIMGNLPDMGVSIFGPHISRDSYKKVMEVAEGLKMQCKDRKTITVTQEHFDIINFACENPIDPEVLEHMLNKELFVCFWKIADSGRGIRDRFIEYIYQLTQPRNLDTGEVDPDGEAPPILSPLEIKIATKLEGVPEKDTDGIEKEEEKRKSTLEQTLAMGPLGMMGPLGPMGPLGEPIPPVAETTEAEDQKKADEARESVLSSSDAQIILVPAIWAPLDARTHASLIYVFFRQQTGPFLPPDPVPDPPHVIMAFDAHKKKDIFEVVHKHAEDVLLYGFFTNDNPDKAELIASSLKEYEGSGRLPSITDKLILKVAKATSHTMLAFAEFGPSYFSANTVVGKEEALKLFPEGYKTEEAVPVQEAAAANTKKKKSKSKHVEGLDAEIEADESTPEGEENDNTEDSPRQQANEEN